MQTITHEAAAQIRAEYAAALGPKPAGVTPKFGPGYTEALSVGVESYSVCMTAPSYPQKFGADRAAAEAFARKTGRTVSVDIDAVRVRTRWV
jgi:hypothetical protein